MANDRLRSNSAADDRGEDVRRGYETVKRVTDVALAITLLVALAPLLVLLALLVRIFLGKTVFFLQQRTGRGGKSFTIFKFRTLMDLRTSSGEMRPDSERVNAFGQSLRRIGLDELPQLWNVLRGDMSLVGPRPLLPSYLTKYSTEQAKRHSVRPGITGWAQINGRTELTWLDQLEKDVWYVEHRSTTLDGIILVRSLSVIFTTVFGQKSVRVEVPRTEFRGHDESVSDAKNADDGVALPATQKR
jgi:lipopolysaccharide/colanic/teichoic acid biosynthesis glycosyltransferase